MLENLPTDLPILIDDGAHKIGLAKTGRKCFIKLWNLIGDLYLFWSYVLRFPRLRQALSVIRKPENVWISTWGNKKK